MLLFVALILLEASVGVAAFNCTIPPLNSSCESGYYFHSEKQICRACKVCPPGEGVVCGCRYHSNTHCQRCSEGKYSKFIGRNRYCFKCTVCKHGQFKKKACTNFDDAECISKPVFEAQPKEGKSHKIYIVIIGVLVAILVLVASALIYVCCRVYDRRYRGRREITTSNASEAQCLDVSSVSDAGVSWRKERLKYSGSSMSSLEESRMMKGRDSIQSSCLSSEPLSSSERPSNKTLLYPDVQLCSVPASVYQALGRLLNPSQAYRDWQTLAGRLGKTQMDIENIKLRSSYDYTEQLLLDWCTAKPNATVGELFRILNCMAREDAAAVLLQYDKRRDETQV